MIQQIEILNFDNKEMKLVLHTDILTISCINECMYLSYEKDLDLDKIINIIKNIIINKACNDACWFIYKKLFNDEIACLKKDTIISFLDKEKKLINGEILND